MRSLQKIAKGIEEQNVLLRRLADKFAPESIQPSEEMMRTAGPSFSRDEEQGRVLDWCRKVYEDTGREPTDEEIADWLDGRLPGDNVQ